MKKKNGFTLIELLAVIIILGILMIIAIPSVTNYISNSRKSAYVDTAKEIVSGTRNVVNSGKLGMYDTNTTYYIPASYIKTENASKSPYGDFTNAYVVVIYDGKGYSYYWISVDDAGQGVKGIISVDKLEEDNIESDIKPSDIQSIIESTGIGSRNEIKILNPDTNEWRPIHLDDISGNISEAGGEASGSGSGGGTSSNVVVYPSGKTKDTVVTGDIVTIDTEEFYVVKHDGNDLILLSHYNLNVGSNKKPGATEGIQDSEVKGWLESGTTYGNIEFSSTYYWNGKVGTDYPGSYCTSNTYTSGTNCTYVYDANSNLFQYVNTYKTYLEGKGATIKSARLLRIEEAFELGCGNGTWTCNNAPAFVKETSYWLGSPYNSYNVWRVGSEGYFSYYLYYDDYFGVRPVIVI